MIRDISTSFNPHVASEFSRIYRHTPDNTKAEYHLAHINVPKGSKVIYLNPHGKGITHEHEVLLPRDSKFKYMGKDIHKIPNTVDEYHIHHLTHIPEE
jgi:hypothetical protein